MAKYLVIVESPAKSKTIKKYLGANYNVQASYGHVRDLPKSTLGVDLDNDFEPHYINIHGKGDLIKSLKAAAESADKVFLATDPDREGEAISWHLMSALSLDPKKTRRITFNEITKTAVTEAVKNPRDIDIDLVDAQQARRVLDRVTGYKMSPVLWRKVKKGLSAGRVQSAALKLICDRDAEIEAFVPEEYWTLDALCVSEQKQRFKATLASIDGKKAKLQTGEETEKIKTALEKSGKAVITSIKTGSRSRKAPDPFITSTLQQEASRKLNFTPSKTMSVAQQLYEGMEVPGRGSMGLITYLRTDSVRIADEAKAAAEKYIVANLGAEYAAKSSGAAKSGVKIQDAHEAIRPTDVTLAPATLKDSLTNEQYKLYKLIWERFLASRMAAAEYDTYTIELNSDASGVSYGLSSSGSTLRFAGFLKVYKEEEDENETKSNDKLDITKLVKGETIRLEELTAEQHFTEPARHYTESSLIRAMQELGIGRPSTYAPTVSTLLERGYVTKDKKLLLATELGSLVNGIMCEYFAQITDAKFTADMENRLDSVAAGEAKWKDVMRDFYKDFAPCVDKAMAEAQKVKLEDEVTDIICDKCGRNMVIKLGKFGKFYACPGFPECRNTKPYFETIGVSCPKCGAPVQLKKSKKGRAFYTCENNGGSCDFISWDRPTNEACPKCGGRLYQRFQNRKPYLACLTEGCGYTKNQE